MRISNNFNLPTTNFRGIKIADEAASVIHKHINNNPASKSAYKKLEQMSDEQGDDIYVQLIYGTKEGLNLQVIDTFTQETKCYLNASDSADTALQEAPKKYADFLKEPQPPRDSLPKGTEEKPQTSKLRKLLSIFY